MNFKELKNVVDTVEEECHAKRLVNAEMFMFTDNSVTESCFYQSNYASPQLHQQVLRIRQLEMEFNLLLHLIHCSGTRIILQGTDGCSRNYLMEGIMDG